MSRVLLAMLLMGAGAVCAEAPVTGRGQQMSFARTLVQQVAARAYQQELERLESLGMLDTDPVCLERVRRVASVLIAQAIRLKPEAAGWKWEVHLSDDPEVAAYSMAGGKLLVGSHFMDTYHLSDDELAVALAHEVGHVIAEHVREQLSRVASLDPPPPGRTVGIEDALNAMDSDISVFLRLQPLSRLQEMEADDIGVELAARSGIAPSTIKHFYTKLTREDTGQSLFDTHGATGQREAFVMSMADYAEAAYEASQGASLPTYVFRP